MGRAGPCWVIVVGPTATAFRARRREDLVPTLRQLQRTQSDVELRWFDRGRLWASPEEARSALSVERRAPRDRSPDWRPGGSHKDPRARFKLTRDQKRAQFKQRQRRPHGADDLPRDPDGPERRSASDRQPAGAKRTGRPAGRSWSRKPSGQRSNSRPHGRFRTGPRTKSGKGPQTGRGRKPPGKKRS